MTTADEPASEIQQAEMGERKLSRLSSLRDGFWGNAFLAFMVALVVFAAEVKVDNQRSDRAEQTENLRFVRERSDVSEQPRPFRGMNLNDQNLSGLELKKADFRAARLHKAVFTDANLEDANFKEADLRKANFGFAEVCGADFQQADLRGAWLGNALEGHISVAPYITEPCLHESNFSAADLRTTQFIEAELRGANFAMARLEKASFSGSNLGNASFHSSDLRSVEFGTFDLGGATFRNCDLRGLNFYRGEHNSLEFLQVAHKSVDFSPVVDLTNTNFWGSDIRGANFWGTDIRGADFSQAQIDLSSLQKLNPIHWGYRAFEGAIFDESTRWPAGFTIPGYETIERYDGTIRVVSYGDEEA